MADEAQPDTIAIHCPQCRHAYRVSAAHVGKKVQCRDCSAQFTVASDRETQTPPTPQAPADAGLCNVCRQAILADEAVVRCPGCDTEHHQECWEYNDGCSTYGCDEAPDPEGLDTHEIPASYWGKEEKECPVCGQAILAAAVRCRHCSSTFASAQPQNAAEFGQKATLDVKLRSLRKGSVWLLVFSLLTCTAPFAAVVAAVWYYRNRFEIQKLTGLHRAICKLALGLAVGQTIVMILVAALHGVTQG